MELTPDQVIYWQQGSIVITAALVNTWIVMLILVIGSWLATRKLRHGSDISRLQNLLEVIVKLIRDTIYESTGRNPDRLLPFIGTLFLFILVSNVLGIIPGFHPPTGSLNVTAALALCVFVAVPFYGLRDRGLKNYLKNYLEPTPFMLPFNIFGEISRTLALAMRLFGNIMSGALIVAILLSVILAIAPILFPMVIVMQVMGLLTGVIQAYIFAVLALVYICSATGEESSGKDKDKNANDE